MWGRRVVGVDGAREAAVESTESAVGLKRAGVARLLRVAVRLARFQLILAVGACRADQRVRQI